MEGESLGDFIAHCNGDHESYHCHLQLCRLNTKALAWVPSSILTSESPEITTRSAEAGRSKASSDAVVQSGGAE